MFGSVTVLAALAAASLAGAQNLGKPVAYDDGLSPHYIFGSSLPRSQKVSVQDIDTPSQCSSYGGNQNSDGSKYCPSGQFTSQSVQFEDCGAPFEFCQCNDGVGETTTPLPHLIHLFSRLPPALKQNIRYVLSMSYDSVWAETFVGPNDVLLFGNATAPGALDVFIHETSHALDLGTGSTTNSSTQAWSDAVNADSCVPDSYANSNLVEDFAQVSVIHTWLSLHDGNPPDSSNDLSCMSNQIAYFDDLNTLSMTEGKCSGAIKSHFGYSRRRRSVPRAALASRADEVTDDIPVVHVAGIEGVTV